MAKTEMSELGLDTEGMVDSTAKLRSEIYALSGVDIMENAYEFKSTYKIMDELASKWKNLTDIQQASVTELIAGKRQGNIVSSLMNNFDTARQALETSLNSSGSAMAEHEKWQQSLEAQINKLKASWQGLSQAFLSSDFLKSALDGVIGLVDGLTKLIDTFGALPTLTGIFAGGMSLFKKDGFKGFATFDKQTKSIKLFGTAIKDLGGGFGKISTAINTYNSNLNKSTDLQNAYVGAIGKQNSGLGKYLSGLNGAKASMKGYASSLIGATAKTIGFQVATTLLNAALTMGISFLISAGISALTKWINAADELAEKVDEVTSKYKEQHKALKDISGDYDTTNESSMISKYGKLSKGVDGLGRNISLTADEYSEYQSIVETIAGQIPSLVSGYDEQGNAMLSCKGNIQALREEYEKLIKTQNDEVLINNAGDINKDFKNAVKDAEHDTKGFFGWNWTKELNLGSSKLSTEAVEAYEKILKADDAIKEFDKATHNVNNNLGSKLKNLEVLDEKDVKAMSKLLEDAGFEKKGSLWDGESSHAHVERALKENKAVVEGIINQYYASLEKEIEGKKAQAQAALSNAFDISDSLYYGMSDTMKNIAYQVANGFDFEFFADLDENGIGVEEYVNNMLNQLNSLDKNNGAAIEAAFDLQTQFNGNEISYGEYVNGLENTGNLIDDLVNSGSLDQEIGTQIKLNLGLDEDGLVENYKSLSNRLQEIGLEKVDAEGLLDSLSAEELSVMTQIIPEIDASTTREQLQALIDKEMVLQGLTFDLNLEVEAAGIESFNTALSESVTATGLSSDSISALKARYADLESQGWDLSSMFEETSHGVHLNRSELSKFENELSKQKLDNINNDLAEMKSEYDNLGEAIKNCDDPLKKSELFNDRQSLAQKISEAATLAAQYEGLTSAYNDWLAAESSGNERDMYENVISGFDTVKDEISRGWYDDSTIEFLEMITGRTDLAGKSGKELKEVYDSLDKSIKFLNKDGKVLEDTGYSVRDFFTVDDEGNSTSKGVYNFLDAIGKLEEEAFGGKDIVKRDKNGKVISFDFELAGGDKAIADALGISEELVQIMKRAADDAGFVVSMDGTYKQLADLQNEAKSAADYLKEIGKTDFNFDFNTSSVSNIKDQLKEAKEILKDKSFWNTDGTFNFNAKGATEAMQIVSTLQAKLDKLTHEQYGIGLTVEDDKYEDALESLQNYGETVATLNQLELNPKANAEEIKELEADLDTYAQELNNLPDDVKVEIGLVGKDGKTPLNDVDAIKTKAESGEIKIPTTLDIQTNIDKNLSDLRDLALLNSGLLSPDQEEAIKIRLGIEVEAGEVDASNVENEVDNAINNISNENSENNKVETTTDVEIKAGEVDTSNVDETIKNEVKTGAEGNKNCHIGVAPDVEVKAGEVKTDDVEKKTEEAVKNASGETESVEKEVALELDISDHINNLSEFEEIAKSLSELGENVSMTITAKIDGNVLNAEGNLDNLSSFAEGAKSLQGVESSYVTVTASLEGNVTGKDNLDKLSTFAEGAKDLDGAKSAYITVYANLDGNLDEIKNIDSIVTFADGAKALDGAKSSYININAQVDGNIKDFESEDFEKLQTLADGAVALDKVKNKNIGIAVSADINGNIDEIENIDNLTELASGAEELDKLKNKDVSVTVTANFEGTLKDSKNIDSLATFVQSAQDLKDVKDSTVTITANIEGDALDFSSDQLASLQTLADGAVALDDIEKSDISLSISANVDGTALDFSTSQLENLTELATGATELDKLKNKDISVNVNANLSGELDAGKVTQLETFADGAGALDKLKNKDVSVSVEANLTGEVSWSGTIADLGQFATHAQTLQDVESKEVTVTANIAGTATTENVNTLSNFASIVNTLQSKNVDISVKASVDTASINSAIDLLGNVANSGLFKDYNATVTATVNYNKGVQVKPDDKAAKVNYKLGEQDLPKDKTAKVNYSLGTQASPKPKTVAVNYVSSGGGGGGGASGGGGGSPVNGTANADGTVGRAYKNGSWGAKNSGTALMGELGRELIVRDGKWFTVGDSGAGFYRYEKGDIIFNHKIKICGLT